MSLDALVLHDVVVLYETDIGWLCQVGEARVFIAKLEIQPGVLMPAAGQRGTVTVDGYAADRVRKTLERY